MKEEVRTVLYGGREFLKLWDIFVRWRCPAELL